MSESRERLPLDIHHRYDTIGGFNFSGSGITVRFWSVDFTGGIVVHCHILYHEDRGMIAIAETVE